MPNKAAIALAENIPSVGGGISAIASANAPFLYFENAPFFAYVSGVGRITLEVGRQAAPGPNNSVVSDRVLVAHLAGNMDALRSLRSAIDGILLAAEKPQGAGN
jgi:hypothetical protein